ncbi:MAG: M48 family metalloprotease [Proteobacteria bacterium]|nr:M48 family metalloprotease [Pseudomonadota bacterium]
MRLEPLRALLLPLTLLGGLVFGLSGCTTNPVTGGQSFTPFMSPADEKRIGAEEHPKLLAEFGGAYEEGGVANYVSSIGNLLKRTSETPNERFTFTVVDSPVVNAFALPGGYVYVTRGLITLADDEAELAGVIAHEIGHVTARHTAERYSRGMIAGLGAGLLGILTESPQLGQLGQLAAAAYIQGYSREQEFEADALGIRYMTRAGYDPRAMASFLTSLEAGDRLAQKIAGKEGTEPAMDLFRSHPRTGDRIARAAEAARSQSHQTLALDREPYLAAIDGLLYGDSPAQGFVRGRLFIHPELLFRFEAPPGFRLRNSSEAVIGEHENGALIIFDGAKPSSANQGMLDYLRNDWAKGRGLESAERITINGLPAATGQTRINTNEGRYDARLVAIRLSADAIYRFLMLTPRAVTDALNEGLRRTTFSFRRIGPSEAAQYRTRRLQIVVVGAGDTPEGFARLMRVDDFPLETFRVLNGLRPGEALRAGQRVKIVVE